MTENSDQARGTDVVFTRVLPAAVVAVTLLGALHLLSASPQPGAAPTMGFPWAVLLAGAGLLSVLHAIVHRRATDRAATTRTAMATGDRVTVPAPRTAR